ncbi:MAG: hypothetical protein MZW92_06580 [Comamonadaceae bacterium]|nr:hypothetical protein [Comamonadaceae bacterium]
MGVRALDVVDGPVAELAGNLLPAEFDDFLEGLFGLLALVEVEVPGPVVGVVEQGHLTAVDPVGVHDDEALPGLPEYLREPHDRERTPTR